jgi:hypothetical protein
MRRLISSSPCSSKRNALDGHAETRHFTVNMAQAGVLTPFPAALTGS